MFSNQEENEVEWFSLKLYGAQTSISDNFTLGEFACSDGSDIVKVHPSLVALLQQVRNHFDAPVTINSAYRTKEYNKSIGGAKKSKHVLGMAADIVVKGVEPSEVASWLESEEIGGVGRYKTFTHCDVWGFSRRWED